MKEAPNLERSQTLCFVLQDPYVLRQLPFLIGSANFMEDDNVGIEDVSGSWLLHQRL